MATTMAGTAIIGVMFRASATRKAPILITGMPNQIPQGAPTC